MSKLWSIRRQVRFWKLCGFTRCDTHEFKTWQIGNKVAWCLPVLDMNNLMEYAVKGKFAEYEQGSSYNSLTKTWHYSIWHFPEGWESAGYPVYEATNPDPVLALATACEKALLAEKKAKE